MAEISKRKRKNKKRAWEKVMSSFTDDLWTEILLRLPIKSLLRFKSVCKSWFSIISSHRFAKSHHAIAGTDDQVVIVHLEPNDNDFDADVDGSFSLIHLGSEPNCKNLDFPYSQGEYPSKDIFSTLIGSHFGIVCVSVDVSDWSVTNNNFDIYLWNPATKHSKLIPRYNKSDNAYTSGSLGFAFDHIDSDFKLVKVQSRDFFAKVYSSNRNEWRCIEPRPIDVPQRNVFDICFHGFLFAIGNNSGMMAFNLNKELFICDINLPVTSFDDAQSSTKTRVSNFNDTIAVIFCTMDNGKIQLWTLDNEACLCGGGVQALWTKVLSIDVGLPLYLVEGLYNNSQFLVVGRDGNRFMYDLNKKVTKNFTGPYFEATEIFKYTARFIGLGCGNG
ncbi:F-box/kelch-repeat protein At3g23880-like [Apium graveolens]|uniref:F-box/kelch-repeat protein At3g23880-like n=1 Tax=Apium graveolens TaxID=4045 RepID=UPI003D7A8C55